MKITKDGIIHTIVTEPIFCNRISDDYLLSPTSYTFKIAVKCGMGHRPSIRNVSLFDWLYDIFGNRLIATPNNNTESFIEFCSKITAKDILFVEQVNDEHILNTMFQIMTSVLDEHCELISLSYG